MAIEKCCENCAFYRYELFKCEHFECYQCWTKPDKSYPHFKPEEELVRADERNKTIDDLLNIFFCKYGNTENIPVKEILEILKEERTKEE